MRDPNIQDALEDDLKTIAYNKAIEALIPVVREDITVFEGFIIDEYPDYMDTVNDMSKFHEFVDNLTMGDLKDKWLEYVEDEARRRADG